MVTPLIKSQYKFKELSGKHPLYNKVFVLDARAGERTYIDGLLEELPNCAAFFEQTGEDTFKLSLFFFPDNPNCSPEDVAGSYAEYQGGSEIFLSQQKDHGAGSSICFFRRGGFFELCDTDSNTIVLPQNVDIEKLKRQQEELAETYTKVQTSKDAVSMIWDIGEEVENAAEPDSKNII